MPRDRALSDVAVWQRSEGSSVWVGLHGWNGTRRTFDPLLAHLSAELAFYAVDLPGYGASARPPEWRLPLVGESVVAALREVGVERCSLIGSCSGGVVGLFVAKALGEDLDHFVWLEPFAYVPWYLSLLTMPLLGRLFYAFAFGTNVGRGTANAVLADDGEPDLMASFEDTDLDVPYRYLQLFGRLGAPEQFEGISGTKHLLHAERTFGAVRTSVRRWEAVWPDAVAERIDGAGHLLLEEVPSRVGAYLRDRTRSN